MKLSAQIQIRPNTEATERFSNEKSLIAFLKGLFIKKEVTVIEENFSAPDILSRMNVALKNCGITNLIRVSHDDTEFYLDKDNQPDDLDKIIKEFNDTLRNAFERFYEKIAVIMEINHEGIDFMVELNLTRLHPVGEFPIQLFITGVPAMAEGEKTNTVFKLFVEKLELNISKFIDVADIRVSYHKAYSSVIMSEDESIEIDTIPPKDSESQKCIFFPLYGISLGESTVSDLSKKGVKATDYDSEKKLYKYYTINDMRFWHNDKIANQIYITYTSPLPPQWRNCGLDWELSYNEWNKLFKKLGFHISIVKNPQKEWYNGRKTLLAEFHASKKINNNVQLIIEVYFNYSDKSSVDSKATIYSLRFST